jgi:hypothetical protein
VLAGRERYPDFSYPDEQFIYYIAAERFGWTPAEVDEQPAHLIDWILAIANAHEEVRAEQSAKQQPKTR